MRSIATRDAPFKCPDCNSMNTQKEVSAPALHTPVDGRNLRGSGKADFDRLVGRNSEKRWENINSEKVKKAEARERFGQQAIGRTSTGDYAPVSKDKIEQRKKGFKTFRHAKKHGEKIVHDG